MSRAVVGVFLLAGCWVGASPGPPEDVVPVPVVNGAPECLSGENAGGGALPSGTPTAVVECYESVQPVPGDGQWRVRKHRRATDVARLVTALRLPWERVDREIICGDVLMQPRVVVLEVGGELFAVAPPRDACDQPRPEVVAAYAALTWTAGGERKVARLSPEPPD